MQTPSLRLALSASLVLLLSACGGGDDDTPATPPSTRGNLVDTPVVLATLPTATIDAQTAGSGLTALTGAAKCDVKVVSLNYLTIGPAGEGTNASGVLLLPTGTGAGCTAAAPLVAYARGTEFVKTRTLANPADSETFLLAAFYAAQGYAVVATDYLGYAKSSFGYHPYLHAASEAASVIDAIRAGRNALTTVGGSLSGKLMISGYSQGGHSSAATQRAIEGAASTEFNVVAGAHLAGPYNLSGGVKSTTAIAGYQLFTPFIINSWQKIYGSVFTDINNVFKAPYAANIFNLLPNATMGAGELISSGALPGGTPEQAKAALMQPAYLSDVLNNANNGLYVNAKKNDLLGWTPVAPIVLCGGAGDPTVPPALHRDVLVTDFVTRAVPATKYTVVDVDPQIQATFGPGGAAPTDPASAEFATYYGSYHGAYEPPFCFRSARDLFDTVK